MPEISLYQCLIFCDTNISNLNNLDLSWLRKAITQCPNTFRTTYLLSPAAIKHSSFLFTDPKFSEKKFRKSDEQFLRYLKDRTRDQQTTA